LPEELEENGSFRKWILEVKSRRSSFMQDIAGSGLQSSLVDWIVIDIPKSKSYFGFGLSIQF